eukprot:Gregarina_sp_Poly_1__11514@NODE_998_length_5424_cov_493_643084_g700_i0_p2_GENE_NODE_998_length_5424_cov_493_643084_g700_i0NODE_998_length_5424_cov_493_643084_g700_i0_p2_ORF_typecomplete_len149_score16_81Alpha_GJ/PF03229_13/0_086_NODE_998_length_5424_cov_493_643084_g700_i018842330
MAGNHKVVVDQMTIRWETVSPATGCDKMAYGVTVGADFGEQCDKGSGSIPADLTLGYQNEFSVDSSVDQGIFVKLQSTDKIINCSIDSAIAGTAVESIPGTKVVEDSTAEAGESTAEVSEPVPEPEAAAPINSIVSGVVGLCAAYLLA